MIIIGIIVIGLILRLTALNQSLWLDEAVQAITAQRSFGFIFQELSGDFHPPLYHFLMHFWVRAFGNSEVVLRMPSVLFGMGTIWIIWKIGRLSNLRHLSYLGAIFLATAPFHIYYSQEARMYSMAAFLTAAGMFFFMKIIDHLNSKSRKLDFLAYFVFTILALYTDYYAFLVLLAQSIFLLTKKRYKLLFFNAFFLILCYLPWFPMFTTQIKVGMLATQSLPGWGKLVNISFLKAIPLTLIKFTIGRITIFNKTIYALVSLGILVIIGVVGVMGFKESTKKKTDWEKLIFLWFFIPLFVSWLASLVVPNYQPFRLLLILPSFYLLLVFGIQKIKPSVTQNLLVCLILLINLTSLGVYYLNPYFQREDWRGLTRYIKSKKEALVILPSETSNWPVRYYDPENEIKMVYGTTGAENVGDLGSASWRMGDMGDKIFFIRYLVPLFDPNEKILAELNARGYTKINEISFNQIPLWEYQKVDENRN